jgi:putative transposase
MLLSHQIRLDATPAQREYFARAAGTARRVWNWALAEWNRQVAAGQKPNAMALKKQFNRVKYSDPDWLDDDGQPWLRTIHRDAHAQPFANLAKAWSRYFDQRRTGQQVHRPRFKKKGRCRDSFYLANDKFRIEGTEAVLPKVGRVQMREHLRWPGRIMGASVGRQADHWYLQRLASGAHAAQTALPVASLAVTPGTAAGDGPAGGGKVTPARHEHGQQDDSGQEEDAAHLCARFR